MADKSRSKTADKPKSKITDWCALVAAREIVEGVNISRAHWFSLVKAGKAPAPAIRIAPRYTRWKSSEVLSWLSDPEAWIASHKGKGAEV